MLICCLNAAASTRQRPFARRPQQSRTGDSKNETVQVEGTVDVESLQKYKENSSPESHTNTSDGDEAKADPSNKRRWRPLSDWFASMNQRSILNEEHLRDEKKNETSTTNITKGSSEWPKGRYWPTSSQRAKTKQLHDDDDEEIKETTPPLESSSEEPKEEPPTTPSKSEPPLIQSPSLNLFRDLRDRFRPKQPGTEQLSEPTVSVEGTAEQEERELASQPTPIVSDVDPIQSSEKKVFDAADPKAERAHGPSLSFKLQESLTNAKTFFRQLPWHSQEEYANTTLAPDMKNDNTTVIDDAMDPVESDHEIEPVSAEIPASLQNDELQSPDGDKRDENKNLLSSAAPIFTRLKESATNTTAFVRRKVKERSERKEQGNATRVVVARNSSNPIVVIRNLPWTPEEGKKYSENAAPSPPVRVNPIQFLRGLPWTPQRSSSAETSSKSPESDEQQAVSLPDEKVDTPPESISIEQDESISREEVQAAPSSDDTCLSGTDTAIAGDKIVDETRNQSEDTSQHPKKDGHRALTESLDVGEEEADVMAIEVDDVMSKYLLRQEEESASSDEEDAGDDVAGIQPTNELEVTRLKATDTMDTISATMDTNSDDNSDNGLTEEDTSDSSGTSSLRLDSIIRCVLGSVDAQQKPDEAADTDKEALPSNTTSSTQSEEEPRQSSASPTEESAPATNRTLPPVKEGQQQGDRQREEQPPQQQQQPTVIIMGGGPQDGRSLPADLARRPVPTPSLVLVEALVTILGTAFRIWMISFLAKWWSEEETLRPVQHFVWERLNDKYNRDSVVLQNVLQLPPTGVTEWKWRRYLRRQHRIEGKIAKKQALKPQAFARTVIVLSIDAGMNVPHLEQAVTFILTQHREQAFGSIGGLAKELEVIILVDSPGGAVTNFGLAGAQVRRLTQEAGVTTTVCVDQIAASGGYMIASQADRIFASTFAIVGSIGVIREGINIHDALERHGIKGLVLKAGDSKVPLTMLGSVSKSDLSKAQRTLDLMHGSFKEFVVEGRPVLEESIEDVANGDVYFGEEALEMSLIDRIVTSEEYLLERVQAGDRVMKLHRAHQYVGRRKLFHPLDFLREKGAPLRTTLTRWMASDLESILTRAVAATSVLGAIQFLGQHKFFFGGDFRAR